MPSYEDPRLMTIEEMHLMEDEKGLERNEIVNQYVTPGVPWVPMTDEEYLKKYADPGP